MSENQAKQTKEELIELQQLCREIQFGDQIGATEDDQDVLESPLTFNLNYHPTSPAIEIDIYEDNNDKMASEILSGFAPSPDQLDYEDCFPPGFFITDRESDQLYDQLLQQITYQDLEQQRPEELFDSREKFWNQKIEKFENSELLEAFVQNDGSSSYKIDLLKASIEDRKLGYLPEISKKADSNKEDNNIADFKKQIIVRATPKIDAAALDSELGAIGNHFYTKMEHVMTREGDLVELAQNDLMSDRYDEINLAGILPTSKRETRYLLGLDNENKAENQIEAALVKVMGDKKSRDYQDYLKKRRGAVRGAGDGVGAGMRARGKDRSSGRFDANFEDLLKSYEQKTGRKIIKVKSAKGKMKKLDGKAKIDYKFAKLDEMERAVIDDFFKDNPMAQGYPFRLDDFQARAVYHLEKKESVFVAAHTSAGKTVVAEYAISLAIQNNSKAIYTSPIKALSNQKYREFQKKYGDVGIVTGDVNLNPDASCVIMTTEILRNMLYRGADSIKNIEWIIFDEIHYINNDQRGVVWEESIIMLPEHIGIVMLSATVENVLEFAEWVGRVTQKKIHVQRTFQRPVPLEHWIFYDNELTLIKTKEEKFLKRDYQKYLQKLAQKKNQKNKKKQRKKDQLREKRDAFAQKGNQKGRLRKITAKTMKHTSAQYLLEKQLEQQNRGRQMHLPEIDALIKLVNKLKKEDMLPAICFVFSKKRLTGLVRRLEESICLVTREEQKQISYFFHHAIRRLKPTDQAIMQLVMLKDTLMKGIGVHHGDLLHIGKEIVEILLQKGLIKLLFATDSFAMGLNMPTKTVVFNGTRKFDGKSMRNLLSSEYTQMSGRAGRRGLDDRGKVISFYFEERSLLEVEELEKMLDKRGESLESKFKLSYSILFNALSSQIVALEDIMKKSFGENQNFLQLKSLKEQQQQLKTKLEEKSKRKGRKDGQTTTDSLDELTEAFEFKKHADELYEVSGKFFSDPIVARKLGLSRFALVIDNNYNYYIAVLSRYEMNRGKSYVDYYSGTLVVREGPDANRILLQGIEDAKVLNIRDNGRFTHRLFDMWFAPDEIVKVYDLKVPNTRKMLASEFEAVWKLRAQDKLNPIEWDIYGDKYISQLENFQKLSKLTADTPFAENPQKDKQLSLLNKMGKVQQDYSEVQSKIKNCQVIFGFDECQLMLDILKEFNYINENNIPQLKTRVARELGGGAENIYITEVIVENVMEALEPAEIVALVSIFVAHGRSKDEVNPEEMEIPETLKTAVLAVKDIYKKIGEAEQGKGLEATEEPNFLVIKPVYEWAMGRDFVEICEYTDIMAGAIVRSIQRIERSLKNIKKALALIGNNTMVQKVEKASEVIRRDIVFSLSLYIDQSTEFF